MQIVRERGRERPLKMVVERLNGRRRMRKYVRKDKTEKIENYSTLSGFRG